MKFKKKLLMITMAASMLLSSVSAFAAAERIVMNGNEVEIPTEMGQIREIDDRTFVPIRFLAEAIGYTVGWDEASQTVSLDATEDSSVYTPVG